MKTIAQIIVITETFILAHCLSPHSTPFLYRDGTENGQWDPLFLSQYIIDNKIEEGRQKALVNFTDCFHKDDTERVWNVTSYSGFFTVDPENNGNQFFWYFPPMNKTNDVNAVILWLQGGPGSSSLYGLFAENGPFIFENGSIGLRDVHWAQNYHVIYVDNPVGSGFSFTESPEGYCVDEECVGVHLLHTMVQLYTVFPELRDHVLIISGESYAGKYIPALADAIHRWNSLGYMQINLSGLLIGNGLCDPENQLVYDEYLYQLGLIDFNQAETFKEHQEKIKAHIKAEEWDNAYDVYDNLILNKENSIFHNMTGFTFYYNYLYTEQYHRSGVEEFVNDDFYTKRIHVGNYSFNSGLEVGKYLKEDMTKSMAPLLSKLLDYYYVVFYNGQLDLIVPYVSTDNFLRKLNFTGREEMDTAPRFQWWVDNDLAGYVKHAGKMVQVLVRDAGHMVPFDKPLWALDLIDRMARASARSAIESSLTNRNKVTSCFLDD